MPPSFQLTKHVSYTQIDDEAVLLDLNTGQYFGLNHVGVKLIEAFEQGDNQANAEKMIAKHYDVALELVEKDVTALLDEMLERKLIEQL